jgi:hypothetical protein
MISLYYGQWDYWQLYQKVTFDTERLLIFVNPDVTTLDIRTEVYSAYKNWYKTGDNSKLAPVAIRTIGGDDTTGDERAGDIYFLINNWRIVYDPRKVQVTGVLFSDDYDTPWLNSDDLVPVYPATVASLVTTIKVKEGFPLADEIADAVWDRDAGTSVVANSHGEISRKAAYNHHVHVDTNNGVPGTAYPIGTHGNPVDNFTDAVTIAQDVGAGRIMMM